MRKYIGLLVLLLLLTGCRTEEADLNETRSYEEDINLITEFEEFKAELKTVESKEEEELIDELVAEVEFPLIKEDKVVFIYQGDSDDQVYFVSDLTAWEKEKMEQVADTSLFYHQIKVDTEARFDYQFVVNDQFKVDPLQTEQVPSLEFGLNSQLRMPAYQAKGYWQESENVEAGELIAKEVAGRELTIYLPPNYEEEKEYPVLYFIDGDHYLELGQVQDTLNNLIAHNEIEEAIAVFIDSSNPYFEYLGEDQNNFLELISGEVIPYVDHNYSTLAQPTARTVVAYDQGATPAALLVLDQGVAQNLITQSGYYTPHVFAALEGELAEDLQVYLDWGKLDLIDNQALGLKFVHELKQQELDYQVQIHADGHQWANWRENLSSALQYILGGRSFNGMESLVLADDFSGKYPNYFSVGENNQLVAKRKEERYQLEFREDSFVKLTDYQFKDFAIQLEIEDSNQVGFGLLMGQQSGYTLFFDLEADKIYLVRDYEILYQESLSDSEEIKKVKVVAEADKLLVYLNQKLVAEVPVSLENSKQLAILGKQGSELMIDQILIEEKLRN
ncbi:alpha/beta hydrolase-fold protein [Natroniella sulfidigena]|uniref:alpha/beta hydrolase n=1 Tax=Natroniella sulfidigena TaxID=723921 RepID=UPI00200A7641|nr:alpha/beta hydrolase-fold protein [Natroniella sulfidigena]MCK8815894.1 alpha/beta hydrolase-fold protein [Natroniella sulfidigena]